MPSRFASCSAGAAQPRCSCANSLLADVVHHRADYEDEASSGSSKFPDAANGQLPPKTLTRGTPEMTGFSHQTAV